MNVNHVSQMSKPYLRTPVKVKVFGYQFPHEIGIQEET